MTTNVQQRKKRGTSPRGNFEQSKEFATAETLKRLAGQRATSERLKALRLQATEKPDQD